MRFVIQGELGSNSHMAALAVIDRLGEPGARVVPCPTSAEVFGQLVTGTAERAVLPIENTIHGSVAEHYDLLLREPVSIIGESLLPIRHNLIAAPGVPLSQIRRVLSHPVALSQCRKWFHMHPEMVPEPFYDTAGAVKRLMAESWHDVAGVAPSLAAHQYGACTLVENIEDHAENHTRFYLLESAPGKSPAGVAGLGPVNKISLAFRLQHRPGTLVAALEVFRSNSLNLTRIESRPVVGAPWQYIFFADVLFTAVSQIDAALGCLRETCDMVRELGRYSAA